MIKLDDKGLVPAIVQDADTGRVLTLAYMNQESLERTRASGQVWFYSRSRQELWHKGETSGNYLNVRCISIDCDGDALLIAKPTPRARPVTRARQAASLKSCQTRLLNSCGQAGRCAIRTFSADRAEKER